MSHLPLELNNSLCGGEARDAWRAIFDYAKDACLAPLPSKSASTEVTNRERAVGAIDIPLSGSCWDLWREYESSVPLTADVLGNWWQDHSPGRAVLVLDALSLREAPWILQEAEKRGFKIESARVTGAELPADTNYFARALGFGQRSALDNNGATGLSHHLKGAKTETGAMPWRDCADCIGAEPDWVFWHHWPDKSLHDLAIPGSGLDDLTEDVAHRFADDDFWHFLERLATGRRLVITSDHGYASCSHFSDASEEQAARLKDLMRSSRWADDDDSVSPLVPPVDLGIETRHGRFRFALGRRKWKSQGGYPTLSHGGLTVLEVAVPFIELSRTSA